MLVGVGLDPRQRARGRRGAGTWSGLEGEPARARDFLAVVGNVEALDRARYIDEDLNRH
jgi:hypothetical protein